MIDHGGGHRLGLALFHREGMKAWLDAWSTCTTREARPPRDASDDPDRVRPLTLTGDVGSVVRLVASMAMATLQDVPIVNSGQLPRDFPIMNREQHQKVTPRHLKRAALLYVRQSTMRQVFENTESTKRQYALRDRAVALGWPRDEIVVVDGDLGHTATAAGDREGFERVVTEVGMGRVGMVLGLEVSRLARNSSDWHRLLEICALTETLILDEDGVYNPKDFNDRLLLGLKGQMSEAEIYVMKARLHGGILSKALRGELQVPLPTGLVYDTQNEGAVGSRHSRCKSRSPSCLRPLTVRDPPRRR